MLLDDEDGDEVKHEAEDHEDFLGRLFAVVVWSSYRCRVFVMPSSRTRRRDRHRRRRRRHRWRRRSCCHQRRRCHCRRRVA